MSIPKLEFAFSAANTNCSTMTTICHILSAKDKKRLGCCKPQNVRILYNVRVTQQELALFTGDYQASGNMNTAKSSGADCMDATPSHPLGTLPILSSATRQGNAGFWLPLRRAQAPFPSPRVSNSRECDRIVEGTLHVMVHNTPSNVFHALNDNVLPFFAQVALDAFTAPEWSRRPRHIWWAHAKAAGKTPSHEQLADGNFDRSPGDASVPHMRLLSLAAAHIRLGSSDGRSGGRPAPSSGNDTEARAVCYRRVIWGTGPRLLYNHALVLLRRHAAELLRHFVLRAMSLPFPAAFAAPIEASKATAVGAGNPLESCTRGRPLRIVYYQRAGSDSGRGRTVTHEIALLQGLRAAGAQVATCCDFGRASLAEQLSMAVHADVMLGLHGAGLVHAVFAPKGVVVMELKTTYGFPLDLFRLAADAAQGVHVHIDVASFGTGAVVASAALGARVVQALGVACSASGSTVQHDAQIRIPSLPPLIKMQGNARDTVQVQVGSHGFIDPRPNNTMHILGPLTDSLAAQCKRSDFNAYWDHVGTVRNTVCLQCQK